MSNMVVETEFPDQPNISLLTIAEGTEWQTTVWDAREFANWADVSYFGKHDSPESLFVHHWAAQRWGYKSIHWYDQVGCLLAEALAGPYGLPYNFIVFNSGENRIWYLNDIDLYWPHTYNNNGECALAVPGNFEPYIPSPQRKPYVADEPTDELVTTIARLHGALSAMWEKRLILLGHRDVYATACPGANLYSRLGEM